MAPRGLSDLVIPGSERRGPGPFPARGRKGLRELRWAGSAALVSGARKPGAVPGRTGTPGPGRERWPGLTARVSARREQVLLKSRVVDWDTEAWQRDPAFAGLQRVGGVDVSFVKGDSVSACASLVVLSYPELEVTR